VPTDDQAETDRLWSALVGNDGQESVCVWCTDRWGLSWQITPGVLMEAIADPDRASAKRVFEAMVDMVKIDIAAIEAAPQASVSASHSAWPPSPRRPPQH
jgi:2-polyprenyl-6-hydroxyphenyl methylase/3-demethylubiquinone-9 3-methyltransferase